MESILSEDDVELARSGLEAELKLLEGLIRLDPDNVELLTIAAKGFTGYSMLFLEDSNRVRAMNMYRRGRDYGFRAMNELQSKIKLDSQSGLDDVQAAIGELKRGEVASVYWTAIAWSSLINLERATSFNVLAEVPRVNSLMEWVFKQDSTFYFAGPLWYYGIYYSTVPPIAGGSLELSKRYFDSALQLSGDRFLFGKLMYAKIYAVQSLDRDLFIQLLNDIIEQPLDRNDAELILLNTVSKIKAKVLLDKVDDYF